MASLLIIPQTFDAGTDGKIKISGAWADSARAVMSAFDAECYVNDASADINQAIIDGVMVQCGYLNVTVDPEVDTIRIFGALT